MKITKSWLAAPLLFASFLTTAPAQELSVDFFYDSLGEYGNWLELDDYGYAWQPRDVAEDWHPYTVGSWAYTDAGWTWVSDEPYGWAVYHYGRWTKLDRIGWVWVPGTEWGPAWVSWRRSEQHVGWAPLPPEADFQAGRKFGAWVDSYYDIGPGNYTFVDTRDLGSRKIRTVIRPSRENLVFVNETTNITNITYQNNFVIDQGPDYEVISRRSAEPIRRLRLDRRSQFEGGGRPGGSLNAHVVADALSVIAPRFSGRRDNPPKKVARKISDARRNDGWADSGPQEIVAKARAKIQTDAPAPAELPKRPKFNKASLVDAPGKNAAEAATPGRPPRPGQPPQPGEPPKPGQPPQPGEPPKPGQPSIGGDDRPGKPNVPPMPKEPRTPRPEVPPVPKPGVPPAPNVPPMPENPPTDPKPVPPKNPKPTPPKPPGKGPRPQPIPPAPGDQPDPKPTPPAPPSNRVRPEPMPAPTEEGGERRGPGKRAPQPTRPAPETPDNSDRPKRGNENRAERAATERPERPNANPNRRPETPGAAAGPKAAPSGSEEHARPKRENAKPAPEKAGEEENDEKEKKRG